MKSLSKLFVSLILLHVIVVSLSHTLSTQRYFAEDSKVDEVSESMIAQQPVDENIYEENVEIVDNIIDEKDDTVVAEEGLQASESENEEFSESTTANNSTSIEEVKEVKEVAEIEVSDSKDSGVLYSGTNGTSNWKIFENGLLLIGNGELADTGNISPWSAYASEITDIEFEGGVYASSDSSSLFKNLKASSFIEINNFNTSKVTTMDSMFFGMSSLLELDLRNFDTSKVTTMNSMFNGMSSLLELDLRNFDTLNVTTMGYMFNGMSSLLELDLRNFDTLNVTTMGYMFNGMSSLLELDLSNFDTSNVTSMGVMFGGMSSLLELEISNFNTSNVTTMSQMFSGMSKLVELDVSSFDTSKVKIMNYMFFSMQSLLELDVSNFNTSNVTNMYAMFGGMSKLVELDVSNFDTSKVTDMSRMFSGTSKLLELDASNFNTSNVTTMSEMFSGMSKLLELDVSNFDTSKVTDMSEMFNGMSNLLELDISNFNTSSVIVMRSMFSGMSSLLELDLSNFDTSNVTYMNSMFSGMSNLEELDLSNFDTLKVNNRISMFSAVFNLKKLTLGTNFRFVESHTQLPTISKIGYTGRWIGTTSGQIFENSLDLEKNFAGQADTYVWEEYVEVHPPETSPEVTIPPTVPSSGPVTIAYASQFDFGEQVISSKDQTYSVLAEMHELTDMPGQTPYVSFAQIQDTRINNEGWSLSVTASEFTSNTQNNVLEGSQITLGAPTFIHTGSTDEGISVHDGVLNLIPGASSLLMKSEKREGTGITSIIWGDQATLSNSVDEKVRNDAIQLAVPGSTTKDATTYKATLSWELMATPSNEI